MGGCCVLGGIDQLFLHFDDQGDEIGTGSGLVNKRESPAGQHYSCGEVRMSL